MGFLARIFGRDQNAANDAQRLYRHILQQSRQIAFFGDGRHPDTYEGRIDVLSLHMGLILRRLRQHGEQGERLAQALFDTMVDDFDVALREESLTDKAVSRRIKPMIELFYTRAKEYDAYVDALDSNAGDCEFPFMHEVSQLFGQSFQDYVRDVWDETSKADLAQLAQAKIDFPKIS